MEGAAMTDVRDILFREIAENAPVNVIIGALIIKELFDYRWFLINWLSGRAVEYGGIGVEYME